MDVPEGLEMEEHEEITVQCFPLYSVLKALGNPLVDYFSLDIEGAEFAVLQTIPWPEVKIALLGIEMTHAGAIFPGTRLDIIRLLKENGYEFAKSATIDEFYYNPRFDRFKATKTEL